MLATELKGTLTCINKKKINVKFILLLQKCASLEGAAGELEDDSGISARGLFGLVCSLFFTYLHWKNGIKSPLKYKSNNLNKIILFGIS